MPLFGPDLLTWCCLHHQFCTASTLQAYNYKMFCTIAALSERVKSLDGMLEKMMDGLDFRDANALKLKIMHGARFPTAFCTRGCHWIPHMFA
jgi:hypothetical protein